MSEQITQREELKQSIRQKIAERNKWEKQDFTISQFLLWSSSASSFFTTIFAVGIALVGGNVEPVYKWITAVLGALSFFIIAIDKNFLFSKRATWNALYKFELENLLNKLEYTEIETKTILEDLHKLQIEMRKNFPS